MPILFQYLLNLFLVGFFRVVAVFVSLFFLIDGIESVRRYSQKVYFNWEDVALLILSRMPAYLSMLMPACALLSTMIVLAALSRQSEITVMRASGISLNRILIPFLLGGIVVAALHIILQEQIVPRSNRAEQFLSDRISGKFAASTFQDGDLWLRSGLQIVHAVKSDPSGLLLYDVTVFLFDVENHLVSRLDAERAYRLDEKWFLQKGTLYHFDNDSNPETFAEREWPVTLEPVNAHRVHPDPRFLSLHQLWVLATRLKTEGVDTNEYEMTLHRKVADPVTTLTAILLAFPFAMRLPRQGGTTRSIFLGLMLGFAMFVVVDLATALGAGNRLPPVVAAWTPTIFFLGIGGFLFMHLGDPRPGD